MVEINFIVIRALRLKDAESIKTSIDSQYCTTANPLSGTLCVIGKLAQYSYVFVPIRPGSRLIHQLVMAGFRKSLGELADAVMSVRKSPFYKYQIQEDYDAEMEGLLDR